MVERMVPVGAVELCVETFGDPAHPAMLLIAGGGESMDTWDDELCARLAAGLRHVVRYDHRDTGRSTSFPAGAPTYTAYDLATDALGVLDALGIARAHLVGISMGGGTAQWVAGLAPDRVASLTLLSTSPIDGEHDLPGPTEQFRTQVAELPAAPDPADRDAVVDYLVTVLTAYAGPGGLDTDATRAYARRVVGRTRDVAASLVNHDLVIAADAPPAAGPTAPVPTLVVHGTADPVFPYPHAEALAARYDAELLPLPGLGHRTPPREYWDRLVPALLRHTSGGWDEQAGRLADQALAAGEPTSWFDRLYAEGASGEVPMPWNRTAAQPLLADWATGRDGTGRRAVVVGAGLGADAEFVASLGYDTVAFDVSDTVVRLARERYPDSHVGYVRADLLDPPADWRSAFDLVVEVYTVQALPRSLRADATRRVRELVAPGGTLLAIFFAAEAPDADGPPWPLTREEIDAFAVDGLRTVRVEQIDERWRAEFHRA
ncbi:MAG TPA: alpha/beta fold hydrolase [Actinocatenispora sp.]